MTVSNIEERLKRRFSVSASMEEISKAGLSGSQSGLGPEQAALAQSQHFDQLEALWNKQSPPQRSRGLTRMLTKQSSLQATRISDSEEEGKQLQYSLLVFHLIIYLFSLYGLSIKYFIYFIKNIYVCVCMWLVYYHCISINSIKYTGIIYISLYHKKFLLLLSMYL